MVFPQPFQKAHKPGVDLKDILADHTCRPFELKSGPLDGIEKQTVRVMLQLPLPVAQQQYRLLRGGLAAAGIKNMVGTFRFLYGLRGVIKIKNWHNENSFCRLSHTFNSIAWAPPAVYQFMRTSFFISGHIGFGRHPGDALKDIAEILGIFKTGEKCDLVHLFVGGADQLARLLNPVPP